MKQLKTLFFALVTTLTLTLFTSCEDACDGIEVPEGCTCVEGIIDCDPCENTTCPSGFTCDDGTCIGANGEILISSQVFTEDQTWTADKIWVLDGKVVVGDGAKLTIEAGTIIKGRTGEGSLASALIISRGGQLMANGTSSSPIIMTSILDDITVGASKGTNLITRDGNDISSIAAGKWGGLIILGKAPISVDGDLTEARIEGLPASESYSLYGGTEAADNSGSITYLSVRHGGAFIGEGNEINGITFGGVGSATVVENIEVVGNLDDGLEFFGGTVNVSNAVVWSQGDDAYDIDQGYSGTISNFVYIAGDDSDHGFEIDGPEGTADGQAIFIGGTMKGLSAEYADFRDGAQANLSNILWFNFDASDDGDDVEIDDDVSSANYHTNGKLILTGMEFITTLGTGQLFKDTATNGNNAGFETQMTTDNTIANMASGSIGANTSVFDWTLANEEGVLTF